MRETSWSVERASGTEHGPGASGLGALAHAIEFSGDLGDEHVRWELYQEALRRGVLEPLLAAVAEEPDRTMAAGAVVAALEQVPPSAREHWVTVTSGWPTADFVARRAHELSVLESVTRTEGDDAEGDDAEGDDAEGVDSWTDWLQHRASVPTTRPAVLDALATNGRTRRIRLRAAGALTRQA
ncbi:hypothetical protein [Oerskovia sp. KBS0722]|uniref:hypothetical protein n=1 Tax=Oerskovia sp. KBS0722 TaxID=1179673 RepID=UPI0011A260B4|nr:hypothetical protein [Oerskovia sp. KBS0722]QDW62967.1 hypothetical protein FFI11_010910 [Oerskovia sp. KBS0722]